MALSFTTVQEAYKVLHNVKMSALPELDIPSWPQDMAKWSYDKLENPPENVLLGFDKKYDDGWENLLFFVRNPSQDLKDAFKQFNVIKGNSSISEPHKEHSDLWMFGWF